MAARRVTAATAGRASTPVRPSTARHVTCCGSPGRPGRRWTFLPSERLAIAVSTAQGRNAPHGHSAHTIAQRIAAALTSGHPIPDFG
ncbi:hypothetical protein ACIQ6Y_34810 [Streptomyces sp. NPDC096205]|uniref:hypothetical protein n=1 Tax=Streptomyces sp. NPDC096205 TaxID=3366081 RepID=UPI0037F98A2C